MSQQVDTLEMTDKAKDFLARARELTPLIESESEAMERERTISPKVIQALRDAGLFWIMVPKDLGGGGLGVADSLAVAEQITAGDASTGWVFQAYAWAAGIQAGFLPTSGAEKLFAGVEPQLICGAFAPTGRAKLVDGGLRFSGRWQFGSGAEHADYIGCGVMVVDENDNPLMLPSGGPDTRFIFLPRDEVSLDGNWNVSGLVGTDSQDYSVSDKFVPSELAMSTAASAAPVRSEGWYSMGMVPIAVAGHAAIALGLARRALHEVAKNTEGKKRLGYPGTVGEFPVFLYEFSRHEAAFQGARAYVYKAFRDAEAYANEHGALTPELAGRTRQATKYAHEVAENVVGFARLWSGTAAFREPSMLARAARDVSVATQHLQVDSICLVDVGPALIDSWKKL